MANSFSVVVNDKSGRSKADQEALFKKAAGSGRESLRGLIDYLEGLLSGVKSWGTLDVDVSSAALVQASATITCAAAAAADTVTIAGVVLTAHAANQDTDEFAIGGNDTADAAALATCINANPSLKKWVVATSSGAVVTVRSLVKGEIGNAITLVSSNGTRLAVTGSGRLASGAGGFSDAGPTQYSIG